MPTVSTKPDFTIKLGATRPGIAVTIQDSAGAAVNLTGIVITLHMTSIRGGTAKIVAGPVVVVDAATGKIRYDWSLDDTDTAGTFVADWHGDNGQIYESADWNRIVVVEDAL